MTHIVKCKVIAVYTITCNENGMVYVGSSTDVFVRLSAHLSLLRSGRHKKTNILIDFRRFGEAAFEFAIVGLHSTIALAQAAEGKLIAELKQSETTYNVNAPLFYMPRKPPNGYAKRSRHVGQTFDPTAKLKRWMSANGKTVRDLQIALDLTREGAYQLLGGSLPRAKSIMRIRIWTNHEITADDFYEFCSRGEAAA